MRFPLSVRLKLLSCIALANATNALFAAEPGVPPLPDFEFHAPFAVVTAAGAKAGYGLGDIAPSSAAASELKIGDRITSLVSLSKGSTITQWLVEVRCVALDDRERKLPPIPPTTFFTNTGTEGVIGGTRAALRVRVLGPFEENVAKNAKEQEGRVLVNADYLGLGLDRGCESVISVNAAKIKDPTLPPLAWSVRLKPFSAEETAAGRKLAGPLGLTPERERAVFGTVPALREFFNVMSRTPGLDDILKAVIDVPWWTIIKQGGDAPISIGPQFRFAEEIPSAPFHLGRRKAYVLPFQLSIGGKAALVGKLAVTDPRPPLLTCAGIVGVTAWAPDGRGPRVMLQVISAHREEGASGSP